MAVTNFDVQPFSVLPGLNAYSKGLDAYAAQKEKNKAEVAANLKQQQLMKAIQSGDPDQIFDFVSKNPGSSEYAGKMTNFVSDATKQSAVNSAIKVLTQGADPVQTMLEHSDVVVKEGGDASETLGITEAVMRDPTIARKQAELTLALHAPDQFKAYRDATGAQTPEYTNITETKNGKKVGINKATGKYEIIQSEGIDFKGEGSPTELGKLFALKDSLPDGDPRRAQVDAAIAKETTRGKGTALSINPDGTINFSQGEVAGVGLGSGSTLDKKLSEQDAKQLQSSREASGKSERAGDLLNRAKEVLPQINTGMGTNLVKLLNQGLAALGSENAENRASLLEEFDSISKELGAQSLQLFGGSDTERELEVAIQTNPEPGKTDTANKRITQRKLRAIEILQSKPDFESEWLQRNGALANPDVTTGEFFGKAWKRYQRESFGTDSQDSSGAMEGQTATNPQTGQKIIYRGGQWVNQ